jgi:hypothetical protein
LTGRPRKASGSGEPPKEIPAEPAPIVVNSHRSLLAKREAMVAALQARPELLPLLAANPVLAFRDAGVTISPEVATHVLHALQYPPAVREERDRLVEELQVALGEAPRPRDATWLAGTVFDKLEVPPLETRGRQPVYVSAIPDDARERLQTLLPNRPRVPLPPRPGHHQPQPLRRLDLDAPLVEVPKAARRPKTLSLEALWFYRGAHRLIPSLLRLGVIESGGLPFLGPEGYRKAKSGESPNPLVGWVEGVQFPPPRPKR